MPRGKYLADGLQSVIFSSVHVRKRRMVKMGNYWETGNYNQPNAAELKRNAADSRKKEKKKGK